MGNWWSPMIAWLGSILLGVKQPKEPWKSTMRMGALPCHSVSIRYLFFNFREFVTPRESYTRKVKKSKRPLGKHKHHSVSIGSSLFEFHHFHPLSRCCIMQLCLYSQHLATHSLSRCHLLRSVRTANPGGLQETVHVFCLGLREWDLWSLIAWLCCHFGASSNTTLFVCWSDYLQIHCFLQIGNNNQMLIPVC